MDKKIILTIIVLLLADAAAQTKIESQINYYFTQNGIDFSLSLKNSSIEEHAKLLENFLVIEDKGRYLYLDLGSFKENKVEIESMSDRFRPDKIVVELERSPEISFWKDSEIIKIIQDEPGATRIYFGSKVKDENIPAIFIIEHYVPEKALADDKRLKGSPRLTAIFKDNPKAEVINNGIRFNPKKTAIYTKSFLESDLKHSQFDVVSKKEVKVLAGSDDSMLVSKTIFSFDSLFDRGYKVENEFIDGEKIIGHDVSPEQCKKLGFIFLPGYGYDFVDKTHSLTIEQGWALGIAYSEENDFMTSLEDMKFFVEKSLANNITPIVRIDSESNDAKRASDFINSLSNMTGGKISHVQLEDMPNLDGISPEEYGRFVNDVKARIDPDIKIISAALMPGRTGTFEGKGLVDSQDYLSSLIEVPGFTQNIDYLGSYAFELNESGSDCSKGNELYYGETICIDDFSNYKAGIELLKEKTKKDYKAIITGIGYHVNASNIKKTESLFQSIKEDRNVLAALIYSANSWKESPDDSWLDIDKSPSAFMQAISKDICS